MHDRPHLQPNRILDRDLRLILRGALLPTARQILGLRGADRDARGVRELVGDPAGPLGERLGLRVLPRRAGDDDGREPVEEVAGLLLHRLALVVLRRPRRAVVAAEHSGLRLLHAARVRIHECDGRWGE